jgi:hypothetical protein
MEEISVQTVDTDEHCLFRSLGTLLGYGGRYNKLRQKSVQYGYVVS